MNRTQEANNLCRSDAIAYLLLEKLHLFPLSAGLWSLAIVVMFDLLTAIASNTLTGSRGLLQDPIPWIAAILINPVVVGYYLWSFQAISSVIKNLDESNVVIEIDRLKIERISSTLYNKKFRNLLAIISAISISIYVFVTQPKLIKSWTSTGLLPNLSITIATLIVVYMGTMLILNLINNIQILHSTLKNKKLNVNPLHPDRCGGLRSLSDYSLKTAYLITLLGFWVSIISYQTITQGSKQDYWYIYFIVILYIFLSLACFFGPLLTAHRGMKKAKEEVLHEIAHQFQIDYSQIHSSLTEDAETLKKRTEKVRELRNFYTMTDEFPIWPFDVQTFRRYLLSVSTPLLSLLVGVIQKYLEIVMKK
ncbi:hypothetical protein ACN23B_26140 [Anabaena sp. FACHB-709]|uniref:Gustatory receptor n=2 Tax=Nostocaceae TaxID=1162 RepID=A0A1Z4KPB9_ANAVA|nr:MULTISPECIES: hypothetical protein [Nostocaceae]BAY70812.1 hypothetical protein NIES23_36210 [Trichormus variabilis NIES-23]HBW30507.1 hypothetical protein [Nostoc sp. UBA8866]MBD2171220.1 hypothetical protein [Anabaena cylindrica FACHB-318]MBD2263110.1 hypothetical protein [Anabaena sp. FACHB-709]MBD2272547.1 hypothetical protein [Nostoc sp. PCC 7120 = FACHB-418]